MTEASRYHLWSLGDRLRKDLKNNDHYTAEPMFCLQILVRQIGIDPQYSYNKYWWNAELQEAVYDDDTLKRKQELGFHCDSPAWEESGGYWDRWETVMVALSRKGIDDFMKESGHRVTARAFRGETQVYVDSFYRCREMILLRAALIEIAEDAQEAGDYRGVQMTEKQSAAVMKDLEANSGV